MNNTELLLNCGSLMKKIPEIRDLKLMRIGYKFNQLDEENQNKFLSILDLLEVTND